MSEISEDDLRVIEVRTELASPGPWSAFVEGRDHVSGDDFIRIGDDQGASFDMYVTLSTSGDAVTPASEQNLDFIAHARQDVPRLVAEIRRLKKATDA